MEQSPPQQDDSAHRTASSSASGSIHPSRVPSTTLAHGTPRGQRPGRNLAEETRRQRLLIAKALLLPTEFVIIPLLGLYAGRYLDHRWGTSPWLMTSGGLLGLAAALRSLFEAFKS